MQYTLERVAAMKLSWRCTGILYGSNGQALIDEYNQEIHCAGTMIIKRLGKNVCYIGNFRTKLIFFVLAK